MADPFPPLERHRLVWVDPVAWKDTLARLPELANTPLLADWAERGWPLISRRPACVDLANDHVPLGLPLPPAGGSARLFVTVPCNSVSGTAPLPRLEDVTSEAPPNWMPAISALVRADSDMQCFGSLAWQFLTKLTYLRRGSDLDALCTVDTSERADELAAELLQISDFAPMAIDGEFVTRDGRAVQWREWAAKSEELGVKSMSGIGVIARAAFFA